MYNQVPNSTYAYDQALNGGTIDNVVNLRLNSGKKLTVLGQLDQGPDLVLASVPSITSVEELKGKPLIVDSPVSGYAYLLQKVLSEYGLYLSNGDYFFQVCSPQAHINQANMPFSDCRWYSHQIRQSSSWSPVQRNRSLCNHTSLSIHGRRKSARCL